MKIPLTEAERVENYIHHLKCPSLLTDPNRTDTFYVKCVQVTDMNVQEVLTMHRDF